MLFFKGSSSSIFLMVMIAMSSTRVVEKNQISSSRTSVISSWPKPTDNCVIKNCGPPFNLSITPWPLRLHTDINITMVGIAAHSMFEGFGTVDVNIYPFPFQSVMCDDGPISISCPVIEGDKVHLNRKAVIRNHRGGRDKKKKRRRCRISSSESASEGNHSLIAKEGNEDEPEVPTRENQDENKNDDSFLSTGTPTVSFKSSERD